MAFSVASDAIPVQPGLGAYNMLASGLIYKGQAVTIAPSMNGYVMATTNSSQTLFGIAAYTTYHNSGIAIYGRYNLVTAKLSGAQDAGTMVGPYYDGMLHDSSVNKNAIVTKGTNGTDEGEVLLF